MKPLLVFPPLATLAPGKIQITVIELVKNAKFHSHTKHITIHYQYIHKAFNDGIILLTHCGTDKMPADMFTKVLAHVKLFKFTQSIGVFST